MVTIIGGSKRVKAIEKIREEQIIIRDGDRTIYLNPIKRIFNQGYREVVYTYDVVFINKAKGVKINNMSFGYILSSYSVGGYVSDLYVDIGLEIWSKNGEYLNPILRGYNKKQFENFFKYVEGKILEELGIEE